MRTVVPLVLVIYFNFLPPRLEYQGDRLLRVVLLLTPCPSPCTPRVLIPVPCHPRQKGVNVCSALSEIRENVNLRQVWRKNTVICVICNCNLCLLSLPERKREKVDTKTERELEMGEHGSAKPHSDFEVAK